MECILSNFKMLTYTDSNLSSESRTSEYDGPEWDGPGSASVSLCRSFLQTNEIFEIEKIF